MLRQWENVESLARSDHVYPIRHSIGNVDHLLTFVFTPLLGRMSASTSAETLPAQPVKHTKLDAAKTNLQYLAVGNKAGKVPASLTTRSALTTTR